MRATLETDSHYKFVFYADRGQEMVHCFFPDGERETVTLDTFCKVLANEKRKRAKAAAELRAYRERNYD